MEAFDIKEDSFNTEALLENIIQKVLWVRGEWVHVSRDM